MSALLCTLAAAVATDAVLAPVGTAFLFDRISDRATARSFAPVGSDLSTVALRRHVIFDAAPNGDQIYTYWVQLVDPQIRIPGLPADVRPGSWFISPELARRASVDPLLSERYPGARRIGDHGIAHADELLAYRVVDAATSLPEALGAQTRP